MFRIPAAFILIAVLAIPALAEWEEPKDGKLSEKQVISYVGLTRDILAMAQEQGQKVKDAKSEVAGLAAALAISGKLEGLLKKYDMTDAEWNWVTSKVWEATIVVFQEDMMAKSVRGELDKLGKESADKVGVLKEKIAVYEKAAKEGRRVLTRERRDEIAGNAREDQKSALEDARSHADLAKSAKEEAANKDKEAAEAEKLANNPPADVEKDNRADYIKEKREEARSAREAAAEARKNAADEQKQEKECRDKAALLGRQAETPDLPQTAEEKERLARENKETLDNAREELAMLQQTQAELTKVSADIEQNNKENLSKINAGNLALIRKHFKEIKAVWGLNDEEDNKK